MQSVLLSVLTGIEVPCFAGCQPCSDFSADLERLVAAPELWCQLVKFGSDRMCEALRQVGYRTKGSIISVQNLCVFCHTQNVDALKTWEELDASQISGAVDIDQFAFPIVQTRAGRCCVKDGKPLVNIRCFGDTPRFCMIKTGAQVDFRCGALML